MRADGGFAKVSYAADLIRFPDTGAQGTARAIESARSGVLIGGTRGLPYFLDLNNAVNPHVFVCGITGSGKTYLMRSLMLKLAQIAGATIVLVDFTGEYKAFVDQAGEERADPKLADSLLAKKVSGIVYINLADSGNQRIRASIADDVLTSMIEGMRMRAANGKRVYIMLDEAWKLLERSKALQTLLREGRKYGYGLIFSSQLVEDVDLAMLSNAATLFIFRLQNRQGLSRLAANYGLRSGQVETIQGLGVGSCAALQTLVSGKREFCLIKNVHGIMLDDIVRLNAGGATRHEMARSKLEEAVCEACSEGDAQEALRAGGRNGYVDLSALIAFLLGRGANRRRLLAALRKLGIGEDELADSFAAAVASQRLNE
ncbi:MAG: DUF87 domain-containing protein [Candidatus Micrarchaeota archaeon]|nr:DUF87 domain-containing protein [Candidatus Micrarchaeota archaeon]